jgi:hypothetical protein
MLVQYNVAPRAKPVVKAPCSSAESLEEPSINQKNSVG